MAEEQAAKLKTENAELKKALDASTKQIELMTNKLDDMESEVNRIEAKRVEADKHKKKLEREAQEANEEKARSSNNLDEIDKIHEQKVEGIKRQHEQELNILNKQIEKMNEQTSLRDKNDIETAREYAANGVVTEIAKDKRSAELLMPHIVSQLGAEIVDGKAVVSVLDGGKPSGMSIDDFKTKVVNDERFSDVILGSSASGNGGAANISGSKTGATIRRSDYEAMTPNDRGKIDYSKTTVIDT